MMTLPQSGGRPLVCCQGMRQTDDQRLSARWALGGACAELRTIDANVRPLTEASSAPRHSCQGVYDSATQGRSRGTAHRRRDSRQCGSPKSLSSATPRARGGKTAPYATRATAGGTERAAGQA